MRRRALITLLHRQLLTGNQGLERFNHFSASKHFDNNELCGANFYCTTGQTQQILLADSSVKLLDLCLIVDTVIHSLQADKRRKYQTNGRIPLSIRHPTPLLRQPDRSLHPLVHLINPSSLHLLIWLLGGIYQGSRV